MEDPHGYSSHLPVLRAIGKHIQPKFILELGAGLYSTPLFCNTELFPSVVAVDSLEDDPVWYKKIDKKLKEIQTPAEHLLWKVEYGCMAQQVDKMPLEGYDLIFVDDSRTEEERVATIEAVVRKRPRVPLVVLHDYENLAYQRASNPFTYCSVYTKALPHTALVWDWDAVDAVAIIRLENDLNLERLR